MDEPKYETCDRCRGHGYEVISEWNDQYDATHQEIDTCRDCGGKGVVEIEIYNGPPIVDGQHRSLACGPRNLRKGRKNA